MHLFKTTSSDIETFIINYWHNSLREHLKLVTDVRRVLQGMAYASGDGDKYLIDNKTNQKHEEAEVECPISVFRTQIIVFMFLADPTFVITKLF